MTSASTPLPYLVYLSGGGCADSSGWVLLAPEKFPLVGCEEAGDGHVHIKVAEGAVVLDVHAARCAVRMGVWLLCGRTSSAGFLEFFGEPVPRAVVADCDATPEAA